nr:hypothetical protein [Tanacetum cinerariifolium]
AAKTESGVVDACAGKRIRRGGAGAKRDLARAQRHARHDGLQIRLRLAGCVRFDQRDVRCDGCRAGCAAGQSAAGPRRTGKRVDHLHGTGGH